MGQLRWWLWVGSWACGACGSEVLVPTMPLSPAAACEWSLRAIGPPTRQLDADEETTVAFELVDSCSGAVAGQALRLVLTEEANGASLDQERVFTDGRGVGLALLVAGGAAQFGVRAERDRLAAEVAVEVREILDPCAGHCANGRLDCGETGIDCGGECAACVDPCANHCQNGRLDCGETGIDCGGECAACVDPCANHCSNGRLDCGESGVDCGGGCGACPPHLCGSATIGTEALYCEPTTRAQGVMHIPSNAVSVSLAWTCDDYCDLQVGGFYHDEDVHVLIPGGQQLEVPAAEVGFGLQTIDLRAYNYPAPHCGDRYLLTWVGGSVTLQLYCVD